LQKIIDLRALRVVALLVVAGASVAGLTFRIAMVDSGESRGSFSGLLSLNLRLGQPIGDAIFDGIAEYGIPGLRLRLKQCEEPIFAVPLTLTSATGASLADRGYRKPAAYLSTDVYRGQIRKDFSHFSRLIAYLSESPNFDGGYFFVRFSAPTNCHVESEAYIGWAGTILKPRA
jgi:hypothetical protein